MVLPTICHSQCEWYFSRLRQSNDARTFFVSICENRNITQNRHIRDFPAFAAVCIEGAILGYCKSGGSKEIALGEYSSWRSRLGRQQSSSLKYPDAVDHPMRCNNSTDGAACCLRLAGPQVV